MAKNKYAYLYVISQCNQKCYDCCNNYWMERLKGNFLIEKIKEIDLSSFDNIFITGGEPGLLKEKDAQEISNYLLSEYNNKQIEVFTNGTNINIWPKEFKKLIHIVDFEKPIIVAPNATYTVVFTKKTDILKVKECIANIDNSILSIKNDSIHPLSRSEFKRVLDILGFKSDITEKVVHENKTKIEFENRCLDMKLEKNTFQHKVSLYRGCSCLWYNCLVTS